MDLCWQSYMSHMAHRNAAYSSPSQNTQTHSQTSVGVLVYKRKSYCRIRNRKSLGSPVEFRSWKWVSDELKPGLRKKLISTSQELCKSGCSVTILPDMLIQKTRYGDGSLVPRMDCEKAQFGIPAHASSLYTRSFHVHGQIAPVLSCQKSRDSLRRVSLDYCGVFIGGLNLGLSQ